MKFAAKIILMAGLSASIAAAQAPPPQQNPHMPAISTCASMVESGRMAEAAAAAKVVEPELRKRVSQSPRDADARVALARLLSQCMVPGAEFMRQGELSAKALELLDQALEIQPDHWLARFILASISDRSPPFLGRGKRAAKEYDALLAMQGDRNDNPMFARVFAARGRQLSREGQADSAKALWSRGLELFPNDSELKKLVESAPTPSATTAPRQESDPTTLTAVQVVASAAPRVASPSVRSVTRSQVLLTAGGAADVFQAVQMQPGATRVNEGGDVYTRGGDASETSLIVNGGRILSLGRFEGLSGSMFGALEPFVVKSVRYSSGGFSARHGNTLSGVLEIETDGRPREQQKRLGLSLVQASGTLRSPLSSKAGGWISARYSHTGALLRTHDRTDEFAGAPQSVEMIASVVMNPTPLTELSGTMLIESDESRRNIAAAGWRGSFDSRGDKRALLLRSRWVSGSAPVVVRANATASSRSSDWSFGVLSRERDESSAALRVDAEWEPAAGTILRAGFEQGFQARTDAGTVPTTYNVAPDAPFARLAEAQDEAGNTGSYVEAEKTLGALAIVTGVRVDRLPGETELTADPRLSLSYSSGDWTTRVSGGLFHQGRWRGEPAIPDAGTPSGLPRVARHLVLGIERTGETSLFRAEGFVKGYGDYREFGAGPAIESAYARGVELLGQRSVGRLTGWVSYSLLDAESELESGERVRGAFDITHSATASLSATITRDWSLGTTARYGTGAPHTPVIGAAQTSAGRLQPVYGDLMSERLPSYARLDGRVMRYVRTRSFLLTTFAEILNVTGRQNVASFAYDPTYTRREAVNSFFSQRTLVVGGELMLR